MLEKVGAEANVCVPVNVCPASVRAIVAEVEGNVIVVPSVPASVSEFEAVRVLPVAILSVFVPLAVIVSPLYVLLVSASLPAKVASVPVVGRVTFVDAVVVSVSAFAPEVVNDEAVLMLPPRVIVFDPLLTPVPPRVPESVPVQPSVRDVAARSEVVGLPPKVRVTLVSSDFVSAAPEVMEAAESVPDVTRPRVESAVEISPVCCTTGVALKKPSFCVVAVPILVPVVVSVTIFTAEVVRLPVNVVAAIFVTVSVSVEKVKSASSDTTFPAPSNRTLPAVPEVTAVVPIVMPLPPLPQAAAATEISPTLSVCKHRVPLPPRSATLRLPFEKTNWELVESM